MKKHLSPDEQTALNRTDYQLVAEREIALLEERCTELTRLAELAELEVLALRRQIARVA